MHACMCIIASTAIDICILDAYLMIACICMVDRTAIGRCILDAYVYVHTCKNCI